MYYYVGDLIYEQWKINSSLSLGCVFKKPNKSKSTREGGRRVMENICRNEMCANRLKF